MTVLVAGSLLGTTWSLVTVTQSVGAPPAAPAASCPAVAYVANAGDGTLSVVDLDEGEERSTIEVGVGPGRLALHPDSPLAYVTNYWDDTVSVVDLVAETEIDVLEVATTPRGIAITPDGATLYVTHEDDGDVSVIDLDDTSTIGTIDVGGTPTDVAVSPDGSEAYVTSFDGDGGVVVIDTTSNTVDDVIPTGSFAFAVAFDPSGEHAYVANQGPNLVTVIDVDLRTTETVAVGTNPSGVAVSPEGSTVYVANNLDGTVSVIDPTTNTVTDTIAVGTNARGVAFGLEGETAYVTHPSGETLAVIDRSTATAVDAVTVGSLPLDVATACDPVDPGDGDPGDGDPGPYPPSECSDVPRNVYFTTPFDWAWQTGVTTGVGGTNVCEPLRDVTRAEAVTILWRTMGSPAVATPHSFTDTVPGAYYQPALRWAAAEGHTTGVGGSDANPSTVFLPEGIVDRAEQFTFVWRVMGRPGGPQHPFIDVVPGSFYHPAANWAADTGVTTGYAGSNRFEPHILVDRAQAFTIAYRLFS